MTNLGEPDSPIGKVDWEHVAGYVACWYGDDGSEPGDCYTRVGVDDAGLWWVDDGDDTNREPADGPYRDEASARTEAQRIADDSHEGESGEDAEAMRDRLLRERAGSPDPDGEYAVYWETVGDDGDVVERYSSYDAAEAAATMRQDGLRAQNPGGNLLCGYSVRQLVGGRWIATEDEEAYDDEEVL